MVLFREIEFLTMGFPERLVNLRKQKNLTQQALADKAEIHVAQVRRYESGETQPSLDIIKRLSVALRISADLLVFDSDERGPDDDLRLQFEAISQFNHEDKQVIKAVLEGMILKYEAERISRISK